MKSPTALTLVVINCAIVTQTANAQTGYDPFRADDFDEMGLNHNTMAGLELVIPLGTPSFGKTIDQAPRIGLFFGQDLPYSSRYSRSNAFGFTFDGRGFARLSDTVIALDDSSLTLSADEEEGKSRAGRATTIGLIVVGSLAALSYGFWETEEEAADTTEDIINCLFGDDSCSNDQGG